MLARTRDEYSSSVQKAHRAPIDSLDDAFDEIAAGRMVIVAAGQKSGDWEDVGFVAAAELATPGLVELMETHGRGLTFLSCGEAGREPLAVAVDGRQEGLAKLSVAERAGVIRGLALAPNGTQGPAVSDHEAPIIATKVPAPGRTDLSEALCDVTSRAGLKPAVILAEVLNDGGSRADRTELRAIAQRLGLRVITVDDLAAHRQRRQERSLRLVEVDMPTRYGGFRLIAYRDPSGEDCHMALVMGTWKEDEPVLVRVHSECVTGEVFHSLRCDCGEQLSQAIERVAEEGRGCVLYMKQEGRGIGLINKLRAYKLQQEGLDTVEANEALGFREDHRDYGLAGQMLRDLGVRRIRLLTNNPAKRRGLAELGLEIVERVPLEISPTPQNERYLRTKRDRMGHEILAGDE